MLATGTSVKKPAVIISPSPDTLAVSIKPEISATCACVARLPLSKMNTKNAQANIAMHAATIIAKFRRKDFEK
ncbi:hypothetical protein D3C77_593370 [compost metagenome]